MKRTIIGNTVITSAGLVIGERLGADVPPEGSDIAAVNQIWFHRSSYAALRIMRASLAMTRLLHALPPQFALIVPATVILYLVSPLLAEGSVSGSSILIVFSFASILAIAAIGQTLVIQQGGLDLSVPGVISLAAVLVTKYPDGDNSALAPWIAIAIGGGFLSGLISGIAITRFRVTALVATLAVNALLYGTVLYLTKGTSTEAVPSMLSGFAVGRIYGIPYLPSLRSP